MIREKDLSKTRFFTTNGKDIWKVKLVGTFTLVELVNCETGGTASARVGERSAGGFLPVIMPKVIGARTAGTKPAEKKAWKKTGKKKRGRKKLALSEVEGKEPAAGKTEGPAVRTSGSGIKKGKEPGSQYLGVTVRTARNGRKSFFAQSSRGGKWVGLGGHNFEEDAAAAVQDHLGNAEEATRLRILAQTKTQEKIAATKEQTAFMCNGCGAGYDENPQKCTHCGSGWFTKARKEREQEI